MRNARALLLAIFVLIALVIFLLFAVLRRHNTITTVVSSGGFVGGSARAGDILEFRTYQGGDLGYTVLFTGASPCKDGSKDLKVTPEQAGSCSIISSEGRQVSYLYKVVRNVSHGGPHTHTVIPCKLCYLNTGSVPGDGRGKQILTPNTPSDNVTVGLGCTVNNGNPGVDTDPANVIKDAVATIAWLKNDSEWTVVFNNGTPCADNTTQFSSLGGSTGPSQCSIDPNAATNASGYSYDWSLTSCNGKAASGSGTVVIKTPPPAQPKD
jgi:hypothetical protein